MRPVYVCQLPEELQEEIKGILTRLLLYQCGSEEKAEDYFDMSLADAVQLGMDSKIVDIDCVAELLKNGGCIDGKVPEDVRKDVERLMEIIAQRREMETDMPFLYRTKERVEKQDHYELVNVLLHHGEDDYGLWQILFPLFAGKTALRPGVPEAHRP